MLNFLNFKNFFSADICNFFGVATCLLGFVIQIVLGIFLAFFVSFWYIFVCLPVLMMYIILVIYFYLAPTDLYFTFIPEGTAVLILTAGGSFVKGVMSWAQKMFDFSKRGIDKWDVVTQRGSKKSLGIFGGIYFYGFWPLVRVDIYRLRWYDIQQTENGEEPRFHEKTLSHIMLKPDIYWSEMKNTNTVERIPVAVEFLTKLRVKNPYKARMVAPPNFIEATLLELLPSYRSLIGSLNYDQLLAIKGAGGDIWGMLSSDHNFQTLLGSLENDWGIVVEKNGIKLRDIILREDYEKEATEAWRAEQALMRVTKETMGTLISLVAESQGKSIRKVQDEVAADPQLQARFLESAIDLVNRKVAIDKNQFQQIQVSGSEGLEKTLLNLIGVAKKLGGGSGTGASSSSGTPSSSNPDPKKARKVSSVEEARAELERRTGRK